ncbi:hypothetical protein [Staphylococcus epidermidis]|uniref:hypothetical protein n=1 Tax=Staphylococcus epidermidis TaxID=1282 RepID=UPI0021B2D723|nr:hypothetical protein [Staphylococcus epidermidis]
MYEDYMGEEVIFYVFSEKRIIGRMKEERGFELVIERKVKYKNCGKMEEKKRILGKRGIIFADLK